MKAEEGGPGAGCFLLFQARLRGPCEDTRLSRKAGLFGWRLTEDFKRVARCAENGKPDKRDENVYPGTLDDGFTDF